MDRDPQSAGTSRSRELIGPMTVPGKDSCLRPDQFVRPGDSRVKYFHIRSHVLIRYCRVQHGRQELITRDDRLRMHVYRAVIMHVFKHQAVVTSFKIEMVSGTVAPRTNEPAPCSVSQPRGPEPPVTLRSTRSINPSCYTDMSSQPPLAHPVPFSSHCFPLTRL
jgi:hypothetical protein